MLKCALAAPNGGSGRFRGAYSSVEMVDLDVVRRFDGPAEILDEEEFAEHQVRYGYPPEVTGHAERAASAMLAAVTSGTEPFGPGMPDHLPTRDSSPCAVVVGVNSMTCSRRGLLRRSDRESAMPPATCGRCRPP